MRKHFFKREIETFLHLKICKWCRAYKEKLEILDEILKETFSGKKVKLMILKFRI
jgi:hypothetical protein